MKLTYKVEYTALGSLHTTTLYLDAFEDLKKQAAEKLNISEWQIRAIKELIGV